MVRLSDVARIELGAGDYTMRVFEGDQTAATAGIFLSPGANALGVAEAVYGKLKKLSESFPPGITYKVVWDPTVFVRESIRAVLHTLLEAVVLVVLVVILFLQTWRASVIPLIAVPVSVVGTFAFLYLLGFSINTLTLFGLVLAIGIVVDDAIVVVENVERYIEQGLSPRDAAHQAMREVSGPIIAIALVLCAAFVPMAFLSGVTGQFYKQFAVTIAISTVISAINSLTLSPALAAKLLRPHGAPKDRLARVIESGIWLAVPPVQPLLSAQRAGISRSGATIARPAWCCARSLCRSSGGHRCPVSVGARRLYPDARQALPVRRLQTARGCLSRPYRGGHAKDGRNRSQRRGCRFRSTPMPVSMHCSS